VDPDSDLGRVARLVSRAFNFLDPPDHTRIRRLVAKAFSLQSIAKALRKNSLLPDTFTDDDVEVYWQGAGSPESRRAILAGYQAFFRNRKTRAHDVGAVRLTCPALIIWGAQEWALGAYGWRRIQADLPQARVEILEAGHFVMEEQPESSAALIRGFLRDVA
jgi:pimeloyl-ACP methyl ester carboxylesterase